MYSALMIDIVKSRGYSSNQRYEIQDFLSRSIEALNSYFSPSLAKPVDFSAGDEIQGLFHSPFSAYQYYRLLNLLMKPVSIRAGLGIGDWSLQMDQKGTTAQDGSAYHYARRAIEAVQGSGNHSVLIYSHQDFWANPDYTINSLMQAETAISSALKPAQRNIALLLELISPLFDRISEIKIEHGEGIFHLIQETYWQNVQATSHRWQKEEERPPAILDRTFRDLLKAINSSSIRSYNSFDLFVGHDYTNSFFIDTRQRGAPTLLAEFLGTSRQNIEKTLITGNIYVMRNMTASIYMEMKKGYHI